MSRATMTSKGQTTIPKDVRDRLRLKPGDQLEFQVQEDGTARMIPANLRAMSLFGILKPKRHGVTIEKMNEDIADAVSEHVMGSLRKPRR